jgi:hypothetical protein
VNENLRLRQIIVIFLRLPHGVDFINILRANFSRAKFDAFFGEWRTAFGEFSGIFNHKNGEFSCAL